MSLTTEARELGHGPGGRCGIAQLLATLAESEQAEVAEALDDLSLSAARIAKAVKQRKWLYVSDQTIQRHRQGVCRCE